MYVFHFVLRRFEVEIVAKSLLYDQRKRAWMKFKQKRTKLKLKELAITWLRTILQPRCHSNFVILQVKTNAGISRQRVME